MSPPPHKPIENTILIPEYQSFFNKRKQIDNDKSNDDLSNSSLVEKKHNLAIRKHIFCLN